MPMNYTSLVAPKGTAGSIQNWVSYGNIDTVTILEEAQAVLFQSLRTREMRTQYVFGVPVGICSVALPSRFLDPIGRITDQNGMSYRHLSESEVATRRAFQAVPGGTLGNNPFTTGAANSSVVTVNIPSHGLTQVSDISFANAPVLDGINLTGTFILDPVDANNITITSTNDTATVGNVTGGGAGVTWSANLLIQSSPSVWAIFNGAIQFDAAADTAFQGRLLYYRSPPLLSAANPTNFITSRYPTLIRAATMASAASYMKDDEEEQKWMQKLSALIDATNAESDLMYRGAEFGTDTPGAHRYD